jgi:Fe-S-cluster containining protein
VIGSPVTWRKKFLKSIYYFGTNKTDEVQVDCGSCTACCTGFHIFIELEEREGLEIDNEGCLKRDANDTCTYLKEGKCSIYERRPLPCRSFTCQPMVFSGMASADNPKLNKALSEWRFLLKTEADVALMCAIQLAKNELLENYDQIPESMQNSCAIAGLAVIQATKFLPQVEMQLQEVKKAGNFDQLVMAILEKQGEVFLREGEIE